MSDQAKVVLKGRIKEIFPSEVYGNFEKRVMWLEETVEKYPQTYSIEFTQGDVNVLDGFQPGQEVECHINMRGRHYQKNGKEGCINSLQCWRIKKLTGSTAQAAAPAAEVPEPADDLPF